MGSPPRSTTTAAAVIALSATTAFAALQSWRLLAATSAPGAMSPAFAASAGGLVLGVVAYAAAPARSGAVLARLSHLATATCAAIVAALVLVLHAPEIASTGARHAGLALVFGALFAPLGLSAAMVSAHLTSRAAIGLALAGSLVGALEARLFLSAAPPRVLLGAAIAAGLIGLGAAVAARSGAHRGARPSLQEPFAAALAAIALLIGDVCVPWATLPEFPGSARISHSRWGRGGYLSASRPSGGTVIIRLNTTEAWSVHGAGSKLPPTSEDLTYALERGGRTLVVGPGAVDEARRALEAGAAPVTVLERRPILRMLRRHLASYIGDLYARPELTVSTLPARTYLEEHSEPLGRVVIPFDDRNLAVTPTAAPPLSAESILGYLVALRGDGLLSITVEREAVPGLVATLGEAIGSGSGAHLHACGREGRVTVLAAREPLTPDDREALRAACERRFLEPVVDVAR